MRIRYLALCGLFLATVRLQSAENEPTIVERGPHHRIWERLVERELPGGKIRYESHSFTELETGLHYLSNGQWEETKEEIELSGDGAVARQGPHQVIFASNIATPGAIDMQSPDGLRFRSHVLGLSFFDMANGQSVMFAEVTDTLGAIHPPNQVIYPNCFTDDVKADIRFTYTKAGLEQDIILREDLPFSPEDFGLNSETAVIEILTEFIDAPVPTKFLYAPSGIVDENLDFGEMRIGPGRAFSLEDRKGHQWSIGMVKQWTLMEGRQILLERMPYAAASQELDALKQANRQAAIRKPNGKVGLASIRRTLPAAPKAGINLGKMQLASFPASNKGLVMDYSLLTAATNTFRFESDKTYYISGAVYVTNAIFEGGAVIKYTNSAKIDIALPGSMTWETEQYRPVIFTARDDHSVGEQIGAGSLSGFYANPALSLHSATHLATNARISYAQSAISMDAGSLYLRDSQFMRCSNVFANASSVVAENVLIYGVTNVISGSSSFAGTHTTANQVSSGFSAAAATGTIKLTNSLVAAMTSWGGATVTSNTLYRSTHSGIFQTIGAADHYLTNGSPYRNVGITNMSLSLRDSLGRKTTYPPVTLTNGLCTNALTLSIQAKRDTDLPDIGYHYDPLDYAIGGIQVANCVLTVTSGTAIGTYTGGGAGYTLSISSGASFNCQGTPTALNRIVRYNTVQEQANTNWSGGFNPTFMIDDSGVTAPLIRIRFTEWACPAKDVSHVKGYFSGVFGSTPASFQDNLFRGGSFMNELAYLAVTNCLFERVYSEHTGLYADTAIFRNNTFAGGSSYLWLGADALDFRDNLFDRSPIQQDESVVSGWNAYTTNNTRLTTTIPATDVVLTNASIAYLAGPLGRFYLPTATTPSLINKGSTNANLLGLYHFTISTNQVKETNSPVDIGFHRVATINGAPADFDNDGSPDYVEDVNGNGAVDLGETDAWSPDVWLFRVTITRPKDGSTIP